MAYSNTDLVRFLDAQNKLYLTAFSEIQKGKKETHWMWFIFPQISGLGLSETAKFYAIKDQNEARQYLSDPVLGPRLIEISQALLEVESNNALHIFGNPDDIKLRSCMTLFSSLDVDPVFDQVLEKFFAGKKDERTVQILHRQS